MKNIKKKNGELRERVKELEEDLYSANEIVEEYIDSIPKQKIKDKIEELKKQRRELGFKTYLRKEDIINDDREIVCKISVLEELLQESEDKMMQINFNGDIKDISMILVSAERYALGRMSYIVSWTYEVIKRNLHLITEQDKKVMIEDIEKCKNYGHDIDKTCWSELLEVLKKSLEDK